MRTLLSAALIASLAVTTTEQTRPGAGATRTATTAQADGKTIELFTLRNASGVEVQAISLGAIITSWKVPDRSGQLGDIVLGFDTAERYLKGDSPYFGAVVGRYGNRIAKAQFNLDGKAFPLAANDGVNHLHGGKRGFDKVVWDGSIVKDGRGPTVAFRRVSPDGEEGYPGTLDVRVSYTLTDKGELIVEYEAKSDKPTVVNLTQHSYFNLSAGAAADVLGHELRLNADRYTPVDATLIPTGELAPVEGTPFDFRKPTAIGARIKNEHPQMQFGRGYDHNWVLARSTPDLVLAAEVLEPTSGRTLTVHTTEPGIQFYSGNFLDGKLAGKGGRAYGHRAGFCLETQHFPDSPNQERFPSTTLRPGEVYRSRTVFTTGAR